MNLSIGLLTFAIQMALADNGIVLRTNDVSNIMWPFNVESSEMNEVCGSSFHLGEDYFADDWWHQYGHFFSCGISVYAPLSGIIIFKGVSEVSEVEGYGNQIIIQSVKDPTFAVRMTHLKNIHKNLKPNTYISAGSYIGAMGSTGTTSCHLHLVLYQNLLQKNVENLKKGWSADYEYYYNIVEANKKTGPSMHAAMFNLDVANPWVQGRGSVCNGGPNE